MNCLLLTNNYVTILPKGGVILITNENDFLGILMKCKNEHNICNISDVFKESNMTDIQCLPFLKSLASKGIITGLDLSTYQINPIAFSVYESPKKKVTKSFFKLSVSFFKFLLTYILGIVSGLIIAYLTHKFGWQ